MTIVLSSTISFLITFAAVAFACIFYSFRWYYLTWKAKWVIGKKDPTYGHSGYDWFCTNCSATNTQTWTKLYIVKWFMNPANPLPSQPKRATVYCPDCPKDKRLYCTACAGRAHCVATKTQHHSLEAIDTSKNCSTYFLAPVFDLLLIPALFFFLLWKVGIPPDYFSGRDVCPATHTARRFFYHLDSGVVYYLKDKIAYACNLEDGYFRLILDTWLRAISTDSDSLLLLYSACARSFLFHAIFIRFLLVPVFLAIHVLATSVFHLGVRIAAHLWPDTVLQLYPQVRRALDRANAALRFLIYWMFDVQQVPPPTTWRERPRTDLGDARKYVLDRFFRMVTYLGAASHSRVKSLTMGVPLAAAGIRVLCIFTNLGWYIRLLCLMPGNVMQNGSDVPVDAAGHAIDKVLRTVLDRFVPATVAHVPVTYIVCGAVLWCLYQYPILKNWIDTRNHYGSQCAQAPLTEFTGKVRWFPKDCLG